MGLINLSQAWSHARAGDDWKPDHYHLTAPLRLEWEQRTWWWGPPPRSGAPCWTPPPTWWRSTRNSRTRTTPPRPLRRPQTGLSARPFIGKSRPAYRRRRFFYPNDPHQRSRRHNRPPPAEPAARTEPDTISSDRQSAPASSPRPFPDARPLPRKTTRPARATPASHKTTPLNFWKKHLMLGRREGGGRAPQVFWKNERTRNPNLRRET